MTDDELVASAVASHVRWLSRGARERSRARGRRWTVQRRQANLLFPRVTGDALAELLDEFLEAVTRGAGELRSAACWSLLPAPDGLGDALLARGFEVGWQPHWMGIETLPAPRVVDGIAIERRSLRGNAWRAIARHDGEFAGVANVIAYDDAAGVFDVHTPEQYQRRGIGWATTQAVLAAAWDSGARHATLNATDAGGRLYGAMGFRSLGWGQTWWLHGPFGA